MSKIPAVVPRRPFDDSKPDGYQESLRDWAANNELAVTWFLENAETVRQALQPVVRLVVIHFHSRRDQAGNCYWAFRCIEPMTGGMVEGRHGGGDANLQQALWDLDGDAPPGRKVLRIEKEMGVREFERYVKEFPYAGCAGGSIAKHIADGLPEGFIGRFRA